ncbi:aminopeptidase M1-like, partial [Temnothorax curvispinosus]|uniref:Aminopeptidase M1-like n=1 Tax=Temnothorax curvispinosus TaxID=300111 RepID=A0A6J1PGT2_9HYME
IKCGRWLIATHIQTIGARRIFPCWDDPQIRTTFDISIQHPSNSVALSNMPTQEDSTSKWGLIFYREENLIYNEQDPIMRKIEVARLIAHKIAYQWFGNAISSSRWSSFWLHDGLATLFGEEAIVKCRNTH